MNNYLHIEDRKAGKNMQGHLLLKRINRYIDVTEMGEARVIIF